MTSIDQLHLILSRTKERLELTRRLCARQQLIVEALTRRGAVSLETAQLLEMLLMSLRTLSERQTFIERALDEALARSDSAFQRPVATSR